MPALDQARRALESFILSPELLELESRFVRFNVFEALGVARKELHHSSFLGFILDPQENHGLRELFLRRFLQDVARASSNPSVSAIELDGLDLSRCECRREYQNIDILIRDSHNKIVVVIENKVGTTQHDDQLARYYKIVNTEFPEHRFIGVYLTPTSEDPRDSLYTAYSYEGIRTIVSGLLVREALLIPENFRSVLEQYKDLLGRKFMADQELQDLCASIYKRHKVAIDILRENIPDSYSRALQLVEDLAKESGFKILESDNSTVRFIPEGFAIAAFRSEEAWLESGQMVYLECKKKNDCLFFQAKMDGGLPEERSMIHTFAQSHQPPFRVDKNVYAKYQALYSHEVMNGTFLAEQDDAQLEIALRNAWTQFVSTAVAEMSKVGGELTS
jgi:hypothetical protein